MNNQCEVKSWTVTYLNKRTKERITGTVFAATYIQAMRKAEADSERYGWAVKSVKQSNFDFPDET